MPGRLMAAAAAVLALSVSGCGRGEDSGTATPAPASEVPTPEAPPELPPAETAAGFAARAALSDMFEIESGRIALQRSQDNDVKRFAQMMVDDHGRTSNEARAMLAQQAVPAILPSTLDEERRRLIEQLNSAPAEAFDDRYIDQQIDAHERALALMKEYARAGDNQVFRDWASRTAPAIENHLQMARGLKGAPSGDTAGGAASNRDGAERR